MGRGDCCLAQSWPSPRWGEGTAASLNLGLLPDGERGLLPRSILAFSPMGRGDCCLAQSWPSPRWGEGTAASLNLGLLPDGERGLLPRSILTSTPMGRGDCCFAQSRLPYGRTNRMVVSSLVCWI